MGFQVWRRLFRLLFLVGLLSRCQLGAERMLALGRLPCRRKSETTCKLDFLPGVAEPMLMIIMSINLDLDHPMYLHEGHMAFIVFFSMFFPPWQLRFIEP